MMNISIIAGTKSRMEHLRLGDHCYIRNKKFMAAFRPFRATGNPSPGYSHETPLPPLTVVNGSHPPRKGWHTQLVLGRSLLVSGIIKRMRVLRHGHSCRTRHSSSMQVPGVKVTAAFSSHECRLNSAGYQSSDIHKVHSVWINR